MVRTVTGHSSDVPLQAPAGVPANADGLDPEHLSSSAQQLKALLEAACPRSAQTGEKMDSLSLSASSESTASVLSTEQQLGSTDEQSAMPSPHSSPPGVNEDDQLRLSEQILSVLGSPRSSLLAAGEVANDSQSQSSSTMRSPPEAAAEGQTCVAASEDTEPPHELTASGQSWFKCPWGELNTSNLTLTQLKRHLVLSGQYPKAEVDSCLSKVQLIQLVEDRSARFDNDRSAMSNLPIPQLIGFGGSSPGDLEAAATEQLGGETDEYSGPHSPSHDRGEEWRGRLSRHLKDATRSYSLSMKAAEYTNNPEAAAAALAQAHQDRVAWAQLKGLGLKLAARAHGWNRSNWENSTAPVALHHLLPLFDRVRRMSSPLNTARTFASAGSQPSTARSMVSEEREATAGTRSPRDDALGSCVFCNLPILITDKRHRTKGTKSGYIHAECLREKKSKRSDGILDETPLTPRDTKYLNPRKDMASKGDLSPKGWHDKMALDQRSQYEVEVEVKAPKLPSVECKVEVKAPKLPSVECEVEVEAPKLPSVECEVEVEAPKLPSVECEVEVEAPKLPSVECEVEVEAPKLPSVECEVEAPKLLSVECEVEAPKLTSAECEVKVEAPKFPSVEYEVEVKAPKLTSGECEAEAPKLTSVECEVEVEASKLPSIECEVEVPKLPSVDCEVEVETPKLQTRPPPETSPRPQARSPPRKIQAPQTSQSPSRVHTDCPELASLSKDPAISKSAPNMPAIIDGEAHIVVGTTALQSDHQVSALKQQVAELKSENIATSELIRQFVHEAAVRDCEMQLLAEQKAESDKQLANLQLRMQPVPSTAQLYEEMEKIKTEKAAAEHHVQELLELFEIERAKGKQLRSSNDDNMAAASFADSMKDTLEAQLKDMNEEVLTLQTATMESKQKMNKAIMQVQNLEVGQELMEDKCQSELDETAKELLEAQQSSKVLSNERDVLLQEVEAMKASVEDSGATASFADSMKEAFEAQLKEMNEEVLASQTAMLQIKKQNKELEREQQQAQQQQETTAQELTESQQCIQELNNEKDVLAKEVEALKAGVDDAEDAGTSHADRMKETFDSQLMEMNEEMMMVQSTLLESKQKMKDMQSAHADTQGELDATEQNLLEAQQNVKILSNERDVLAKEVEALTESVEESGATASFADSMKETFEAQLKEMNEEVLTSQTAMLQMKKLTTDLEREKQQAQEQQETTAQELTELQRTSKMLNNERDVLAKEVEALKASRDALQEPLDESAQGHQLSALKQEIAELKSENSASNELIRQFVREASVNQQLVHADCQQTVREQDVGHLSDDVAATQVVAKQQQLGLDIQIQLEQELDLLRQENSDTRTQALKAEKQALVVHTALKQQRDHLCAELEALSMQLKTQQSASDRQIGHLLEASLVEREQAVSSFKEQISELCNSLEVVQTAHRKQIEVNTSHKHDLVIVRSDMKKQLEGLGSGKLAVEVQLAEVSSLLMAEREDRAKRSSLNQQKSDEITELKHVECELKLKMRKQSEQFKLDRAVLCEEFQVLTEELLSKDADIKLLSAKLASHSANMRGLQAGLQHKQLDVDCLSGIVAEKIVDEKELQLVLLQLQKGKRELSQMAQPRIEGTIQHAGIASKRDAECTANTLEWALSIINGNPSSPVAVPIDDPSIPEVSRLLENSRKGTVSSSVQQLGMSTRDDRLNTDRNSNTARIPERIRARRKEQLANAQQTEMRTMQKENDHLRSFLFDKRGRKCDPSERIFDVQL